MGKITGITLFIAALLALQSCIPFHSNLPNIISYTPMILATGSWAATDRIKSVLLTWIAWLRMACILRNTTRVLPCAHPPDVCS